jgi:hypothetical protein
MFKEYVPSFVNLVYQLVGFPALFIFWSDIYFTFDKKKKITQVIFKISEKSYKKQIKK